MYDGSVQWREPAGVEPIDIGPIGEEFLHFLQFAITGRLIEAAAVVTTGRDQQCRRQDY